MNTEIAATTCAGRTTWPKNITKMRLTIISLCLFTIYLSAAQRAIAGDITKGKTLYETHCSSCHGDRGKPVMPGAPNFSRGDGLMQPDATLFTTIRAGKRAMPGYLGILRDREIFDIISFIRTFY